jgi:hypothetical protein
MSDSVMAERRQWSRMIMEGVVIVTSILLALATDAWWGRVQEGRLEQQYLAQLAADFREMDDGVTDWLELEESQLSSAISLLEFIDSDTPVPADSVGVWWLHAWSAPTVRLADGLLQEMIASGSLRLIGDESLRVPLSSFTRTVDETLEGLSQIEMGFTLMLGDPYFQKNLGMWGMYPDSVKVKRGLPSGDRFGIDFSKIRHDREFSHLAMRGYLYKRNRVFQVKNLQVAVHELQEALEQAAMLD